MIKYINGNLFDSNAEIICHQANCQGVMGAGVALELKQRYPKVFESYRKDYICGRLEPGYVNFTKNNRDQIVASMCGQDTCCGYSKVLTNYDALQECLSKVVKFAKSLDISATIALPYMMSCGLAGGDWNIVSKMVEDTFEVFNVEVWKLSV